MDTDNGLCCAVLWTLTMNLHTKLLNMQQRREAREGGGGEEGRAKCAKNDPYSKRSSM